jgi:shikimate dehydrogenase
MIGAVNTIIVKPNGSLWGTNTDAYGFIQNIYSHIPHVQFKNKTAFVIGAGGAARAVIYGLLQEGIRHIYLTNRTYERAQSLAELFGASIEVVAWEDKETVLPKIDFLINSSVLGMQKQPPLEINLKKLAPHAVVNDIVYKPLITPLLKQAKQQGNPTLDGLGMLLYQAVRGFELFFGKKPEVTEKLRAQVLAL